MTCAVEAAGRASYDVCILPHWNLFEATVEHFDGPASALFDEAGLEATLLFQGDAQIEAFAGLGTPAAYLVDEDGMVASELAMGAEEVPRLLATAAGLTDREESDVQVNFVRRV